VNTVTPEANLRASQRMRGSNAVRGGIPGMWTCNGASDRGKARVRPKRPAPCGLLGGRRQHSGHQQGEAHSQPKEFRGNQREHTQRLLFDRLRATRYPLVLPGAGSVHAVCAAVTEKVDLPQAASARLWLSVAVQKSASLSRRVRNADF
jgi:hypothetical protein